MDLKQFTVEELGEIWCNLNCFDWDDRLGDKPEGWDDSVEYNNTEFDKYTVVTPIMNDIHKTIGEYGTMRSWHIYKLERTEEEFRSYWKSRQ